MSIINTKVKLKTKRKVLLTILTMLVIIIGFGYWKLLVCKVFQRELIRTVKSPDGKYLIKTYFHNAGSLSADAVRVN